MARRGPHACVLFAVAFAGCGSFDAAPDPAKDGAPDAAASDGEAGTGAGYRDVVLADGPLAYYRLGESVGPTARDETGRFDGTYRGACALGAAGAIGGDADTAVAFDDDCTVDLGDRFAFADKAPFTVEAWVMSAGQGNYQHVFTRQLRVGSPVDGYALLLNTPTTALAERFTSGAGAQTDPSTLPAGKLAHVVLTYDGAALRLYADGAPPSIVGDDRVMSTLGAKAFIGSTGGGNYFSGVIDEVAIYDKALTPDRIEAHRKAALR